MREDTLIHASTTFQTGVETATAQSIGEWREVAGSRFVPLHVIGGPNFTGSIRWRVVDGTCLSEISASAHRVLRTPALISPDDPNHYKITLQVKGSGLVAQDGRQSVLRPGDLAIYDTSRPYTLEFSEDVHCLVMAFPQDSFDVPDSLIRRITAVRLSGDSGVGAMISPFMRHLSANLDTLDGVAGMRILHSSLDLLTALVYAQLSEDQDHWGQTRQVEMRRLKLYIDAHLHQPDLNAVEVAKSHFMSVRQLQYLFRAENLTVSGYIRARRLENCRLALSDPAQASLSILEIAQRWGFPDASHFSKVFRATYGITPRDLRTSRFGD
ncbi:helix-turn-helix domain-containing protein [Microbacterium sp. zg.B48]|uniref:AraC-like ligand-binding domain-containing protein n=1 Tax=unclassified Microbacterium TaxID=2609290 RepID=UPI00214C1CCD|nr:MULTISPECIES: helix-turn-helix domain-containing protein [unclassified Microbacterium]MCR2764014.1 helix-turn-helix domain-containing protein [Microbacterium sp. zg.B48]MCR2810435.1 helix-turn-helix domain-containing protein [Microbacterium sp. zg.B185]WIM18487.1 helix-turn-helix domain-containing protein [Microbacterium sp. zg-B185]